MKTIDRTRLERLLQKRGIPYTIGFKNYSYWNNVLTVNNTALVMSYQRNGGLSIYEQDFPRFVTYNYIVNCILNNSEDLGFSDYDNRGFGKKIHSRAIARVMKDGYSELLYGDVIDPNDYKRIY